MRCLNENNIQAYIDGELPAEQMNDIIIHLAHCIHCASKVESQKKLAHQIKNHLNLLSDDLDLTEWIKPVVPIKKGKSKYKKAFLYFYVAASIALLVMIFFKNTHQKHIDSMEYYYSMEYEVDANRPITEQSFVINIIDPKGKMSEFHFE